MYVNSVIYLKIIEKIRLRKTSLVIQNLKNFHLQIHVELFQISATNPQVIIFSPEIFFNFKLLFNKSQSLRYDYIRVHFFKFSFQHAF